MSEDPSNKEIAVQSSSVGTDENESLLAKGKGIWPLIIAVFILAIYLTASVVMLTISQIAGRIY